ncbi:MAG: EamA family transporter [Synergistaceae bacterium]|nr:EamA family transporter [Synergistaceae bacterium]
MLIIISNVLYNLCTKSIPQNADSFGTLILTYIAGALIAYIFFLMHSHEVSPFTSFNMPSLVLGLAIVGLEAGYVYLYRAGWKISMGSLCANISLAIVLLFIGALVYHENISLRQIIGAVVCMIGLYLMSA